MPSPTHEQAREATRQGLIQMQECLVRARNSFILGDPRSLQREAGVISDLAQGIVNATDFMAPSPTAEGGTHGSS